MIKLKEIIKGNRLIGYHVTRKAYVKSIMKFGLIPHAPKDFEEYGDKKGIYLFPTIDDMTDALYQWLGERIDEWEEEHHEEYGEIALEVDLSNVNSSNMFFPVEYEILVTERIPPNKILKVLQNI